MARIRPLERSTGQAGDLLFGGATRAAGVIVIMLVSLIAVFLVAQAAPAISADRASFWLSSDWAVNDPADLRFGVARLLWTTLASSFVALLLAVPLSIGIALFLTQVAPAWLARPAAALIDLLAAVPSIVFGLWAITIVMPRWAPIQSTLSSWFGWLPPLAAAGAADGSSIAFAGLILAIMILPIITALAREVFAQTPAVHREAALALGATRWEMIRLTVVPFGRAGVISAAMLGLGRALGETMAVLMVLSSLGQGVAWSWSLFGGGETFASKIAAGASEFTGGSSTGAYIAAGLVLFLLTFVVNAIARLIIERDRG